MNFIIQLVVGLALSIASTLFQQAFAPKQEQQTGRRGTAQIGGKTPQSFLVGTIGVRGKWEYAGEWGNSGDVPNAYNTEVWSFGDLPIDGFSRVYVNGVDCGPGSGTSVSQGTPFPDQEKLWRIFRNGRETTPSNFLISRFGSHPDRPWQSDMIGRGVPHAIMTALWDEELWTGFPEYTFECRGVRLYDPRRDSTAGGSGPQRWGQENTYEWTDNNAVIIYNVERGIYYQGKHIWGGKKTAAQMPYAVWASAMNACDQNVPLAGGGSEKRYRAGREIFLDERPADVIRELLIGSNSRISHAADGTVYILVGVPSVADGAFGVGDVLATEPVGSIPFPSLDETVNGAAATYLEPLQAWGDKETAPYIRSDLVAKDDGREQIEGLDLGTTFSGTQAQRVLKATIEESRRHKRHVVALPPAFSQYHPLQVLAWTDPDRGYTSKLFLITARHRSPWGWVVFGLQEIDPSDIDWNPSTDEKPLSFAPITTNRPAPQEVIGTYVEPLVGSDSAGNGRRGGYAAFWPATSVQVDVQGVSISHRLQGETDIRWTGLIPKPEALLGSAAVYQALIEGEPYEVQITYVTNSGRRIIASEWMAVTIPKVGLSSEDMTPELAELWDETQDFLDQGLPWIEGQIEGLDQSRQALLDQVNQIEAELADIAGAPDWDEGESYLEGSLVKFEGALYRASQDVPAGTPITDAAYWTKIGDYASLGEMVGALAIRVSTNELRLEEYDDELEIYGQALTAMQTQIAGKVDSVVFQQLESLVSDQGDVIEAQGSLLQGVQTDLEGKASSEALDQLASHVLENEGGLTAGANDRRRVSAALMVSALLKVDADAEQVSETSDQAAAVAEVDRQSRAGITLLDDKIEATAQELVVVRAEIEGTVSEAISSLTTTVTQQGDEITAHAEALDLLRVALGGDSAEVMIRWEAVGAPSGFSARYALRVMVEQDGILRQASMFLDVPANPNGRTRIGFSADDTVFFSASGEPIALINGQGEFRSANNAVVINMFNGFFSFG